MSDQRVLWSAREVSRFVDQSFFQGLQSADHNDGPGADVKGEDIPVEFGKLRGEEQLILDSFWKREPKYYLLFSRNRE